MAPRCCAGCCDEEIDRHPRGIKDILMDESMRKEFLGGVPKHEGKAVKAFVSANGENALKTKPKTIPADPRMSKIGSNKLTPKMAQGYDGDHAEIDLLRLRNYTIGCNVTENEVLGKSSLERIAHLLSCMKPFITYLNSVVMPDEELNEGSGEGSEDEEEDSDE